MLLKKYSKESGYEPVVKKLYIKVKKAKAKSVNANVQGQRTSFTAGDKGKPVVPLIVYDEIKKLFKGPLNGKSLVLAYEGDKKKKIYVIALRFATEDGFRNFFNSATTKTAPPAEPAPAPIEPPPPFYLRS